MLVNLSTVLSINTIGYAPVIVFAAPSGTSIGEKSSNPMTIKGRKLGNIFDYDYDIDLNTAYGFAAYDYQGNKLEINNTATTGARVNVTITVSDSSGGNITDNSLGYFNKIYNNLNGDLDITVTYKAYDSGNRCSTATRYYTIPSSKSWGVYKYWSTSDQYAFESRNSFEEISFVWNGINNVASSTNNSYIIPGEADTTDTASLASIEFDPE